MRTMICLALSLYALSAHAVGESGPAARHAGFSAADPVYKARVRRRFAVSPQATKVIGVFEALDIVRANHRAHYDTIISSLGKLAAVGIQAGGATVPGAQAQAASLIEAAKAGHAEALVDTALRVTPDQLKAYMKVAHDPNLPLQGMLPPSTPHYQLGQAVSLDNFDAQAKQMTLPQTAVHKRYGPVVQADVANASLKTEAGRQKVQRNIVLAEVLHRLAENQYVADAGQHFKVSYRGRGYKTVRDLLSALRKTGHRVRARYDHRDADFLGLRFAETADGVETGNYKSIAAGLQTTVAFSAPGDQAYSRMVAHSELIAEIEGPDVNGSVAAFQGVGGANGHVGFFATGTFEPNGWSGHKVASQIRDSRRAVDAIADMGLYTSTVNKVTGRRGDRMAAYGGDPGVCNDSVGVSQYMAGVPVTGYPLLGAVGANALDSAVREAIKLPGLSSTDRRGFRRMLRGLTRIGRDQATDNPRHAVDHLILSPLERAVRSLPENPVVGANQDLLNAYQQLQRQTR